MTEVLFQMEEFEDLEKRVARLETYVKKLAASYERFLRALEEKLEPLEAQ